MLDILQSVPILGFLSITVTGFIASRFRRLLGVEAPRFAIFTSQSNMTFSLYQSLRTRPTELIGGAHHLSSWQRLWRPVPPASHASGT